MIHFVFVGWAPAHLSGEVRRRKRSLRSSQRWAGAHPTDITVVCSLRGVL
jgi:hypothetical protein